MNPAKLFLAKVRPEILNEPLARFQAKVQIGG